MPLLIPVRMRTPAAPFATWRLPQQPCQRATDHSATNGRTSVSTAVTTAIKNIERFTSVPPALCVDAAIPQRLASPTVGGLASRLQCDSADNQRIHPVLGASRSGPVPRLGGFVVEPPVRIELTTFSLRVRCSTD